MGHLSIISGYIVECGEHREANWAALQQFEFDDLYPFTNIFWGSSPAIFWEPIIGFTGGYRQVEEDWIEWMWRFSQLLSRLAAKDAFVHLDCINGGFGWYLRPKNWAARPENPVFAGTQWEICEWDSNDFTLVPTRANIDWLNTYPDRIVPRATERFYVRPSE